MGVLGQEHGDGRTVRNVLVTGLSNHWTIGYVRGSITPRNLRVDGTIQPLDMITVEDLELYVMFWC